MKQSEIQGINSIMFRIKLLAVLLLLSLQLAGQESRYRPVSEYRMLDWIDETAVELPEYEHLTGELRTCSINSYIRRKVRAIMIRKAISLSRSAPIRRN